MIYFPYSIICGCWAGKHSKAAILGKWAEYEILKYINRNCARAILKRYTSSLFLWNTLAVKAPGMLLFGQLYDSIAGFVSFEVLLTHFRCLCQQNLNLSSWQKTNLPHKPALILLTPQHRQRTAKTVFVKVALTLSKGVSAERERFSVLITQPVPAQTAHLLYLTKQSRTFVFLSCHLKPASVAWRWI